LFLPNPVLEQDNSLHVLQVVIIAITHDQLKPVVKFEPDWQGCKEVQYFQNLHLIGWWD